MNSTVPRKDYTGYWKPCHVDAEDNVDCNVFSEKLYRVYNLNPPSVAPPYLWKDKTSYLIPKSTFDNLMAIDGVNELVQKHYFYDTNEKLLMDTNTIKYTPGVVYSEDACMRVDPCDGQAKQKGFCCPSLLAAPQKVNTYNLDDKMQKEKYEFEQNLMRLSFKPLPIPAVVVEEEYVFIPLKESKNVKSNTWLTFFIVMLVLLGCIIGIIVLIVFLIGRNNRS